MNYRHSFHAGNFADVLKHLIICECIEYFKQKDSPFTVYDAFAGTGIYDFHHETASRSPEYLDGIIKIWEYADKHKTLPKIIETYLKYLANANGNNQRYYAGSPFLAAANLRHHDRLLLNELHDEDFIILDKNIHELKATIECRAIAISKTDAWNFIKAKLPPKERRGIIIIDPPFEKPNEFARIIEGLKSGLERFKTGTFLVWYAAKNATEVKDFKQQIRKLGENTLIIEQSIGNINDSKGLFASGMIIINPPYTLENSIKTAKNLLHETLKQADNAKFEIISMNKA